MIKALINTFNINHWSILMRTVVSMMLMILLPTLIAFLLIERETRAVNFENLQAYVIERGTLQRDIITDVFARVALEMRTFSEAPTERGYLIRLLGFKSNVPTVLDGLELYMNERLVASGLFDSVRLVDNEGIVHLTSSIQVLGETVRNAQIGDDESESAAYRTFLTATQLQTGLRWSLAVDPETEHLTIEIIQTITNVDGPIGYIAGVMNVTDLIHNTLKRPDVFINTNSYLVTSNGYLVVPDDYRDEARLSSRYAPVEAALSQRVGVERFYKDGVEHLAFFAPIIDTPFGLITESPVDVSFVATLGRVYSQGFLLIVGIFIFAAIVGTLIAQTFLEPIESLQDDMLAMADGNFDRPIATINRSDEFGLLARTFAILREQIRNVIDEQSGRIANSVRDLQSTQEVIRVAANQRDLQVLMDQVVNLIIETFPNIYHAQIFLVDDDQQYAVLRASTGEPGRQLLSRGHRLGVGSVSVIGQVTEEARIVVARDTDESQVHRRNRFLPDTRAELAVPLISDNKVIGALDVQSRQSGSFTDDQISILRTMADQITIAIENTRLYQESVRRLEEIEAVNKSVTREAWLDYLNAQRQPNIVHQTGTYQFTDQDLSIRDQALQSGEAVIGAPTERGTVPFAVPIRLRGQVLGAAEWELTEADFSREKVQLAQELVNRLALGLDNARLFQSSQRATSRERLVNEISTKLTAQTDIEAILQTAVREVGQALHAPQVQISLNVTTNNNNDKTNGHKG
jgi:GAF domain-containing protein/HAMP domain-containing protein